jgi:bacteriorhodopsin
MDKLNIADLLTGKSGPKIETVVQFDEQSLQKTMFYTIGAGAALTVIIVLAVIILRATKK